MASLFDFVHEKASKIISSILFSFQRKEKKKTVNCIFLAEYCQGLKAMPKNSSWNQ